MATLYDSQAKGNSDLVQNSKFSYQLSGDAKFYLSLANNAIANQTTGQDVVFIVKSSHGEQEISVPYQTTRDSVACVGSLVSATTASTPNCDIWVIISEEPAPIRLLNIGIANAFSNPPSPASSGALQSMLTNSGAGYQLKTAACVLRGWYLYNPNASVAYVQLFNQPPNSVSVGSTTPNFSFGVPALSGANVLDSAGINFSSGFVVAATTTPTGGTAVGTAVVGNFFFA